MEISRRVTPFVLALIASFASASTGCRHKVEVEPVEVKPIHMTVDVNIKVDRELDEFFDFEDETKERDRTSKESEQSPSELDGAREKKVEKDDD